MDDLQRKYFHSDYCLYHEFMEVYKNWDNGAKPSATFGFNIDYSNIKTEKAQIDSVWESLQSPCWQV